MRVILKVLNNTIGSAIYIGVLMFLFIFVYAILGMNIYRFNLTATNAIGLYYRQNFDDFAHSFFAIFQMMTVENWNELLTATLVSPVSTNITLPFLITCQIVLAYTLRDLFQAILLQGFEDDSILLEEGEELYDDIDVFNANSNIIISQKYLANQPV